MKRAGCVFILFSLMSLSILWFTTKGTILFFPKRWLAVNIALLRNPNDVDSLWQRARMQTEVSNHRDAIKTLKKIISINPGDAEVYARVGRIYGWIGELELSYEYYQQAEQIACRDSIPSKVCDFIKIEIDFLLIEMDRLKP